MATRPRGAIVPAYCSIETTGGNSNAATVVDIFDTDYYAAYSSSAFVTEKGITYTDTDGRFTVDAAGIYEVSVMAVVAGNGLDEMKLVTLLNGAIQYEPQWLIHTSTDPNINSYTILVDMTAGQYLNFQAKSSDGVDLATVWSQASCAIRRYA